MKTRDFLTETHHHIVHAATSMHQDHEIQMAREECYHCASNAIELHRMLKQISEQQGIEAWASEKITLANDYLRTVKEWLEYELMNSIDTSIDTSIEMPFAEDVGGTSSSSVATSMGGGNGFVNGGPGTITRKKLRK